MVYVVCFEFLLVECDLTLDSDFHQNAVSTVEVFPVNFEMIYSKTQDKT